MINRHLTVLLSSSFLVLAGCASVEQSSVQASNSSEVGAAATGQVNIPVLSKADNGVRLQTTSGSGFQRSLYAMVDPLNEAERSYLTRAVFFVAQYENCLNTGKLTAHGGKDAVKDKYRNLSPEECYKNRGRIHDASSSRRWMYGKGGRPDDNVEVNYSTLGGTVVDIGWSDAESWNRYANFVGTGANGKTRTEIMTKYHTIMGKKSEKIRSQSLDGVRDVLSNPFGAILGRT